MLKPLDATKYFLPHIFVDMKTRQHTEEVFLMEKIVLYFLLQHNYQKVSVFKYV